MGIEALCGIALCCCAASVILKAIKSEYALLAAASGGIVLLFAAVSIISPIAEFISEITESSAYSSYYTVLIKAMGVAFITHCAAEICRDCSEKSIGSKIELIGKLSIIYLSLPVIKKLLEMAKELIK